MKVKRKGAALALSTLLLGTMAFSHHLKRLENRPVADVAIENLPMQLGEWEGRETEGLDVRSQEILQLTRFVKREYRREEPQTGDLEGVLLYIGYWQRQTGDYQAAKHSPALCLPSNGWLIEHKEARLLEAQGALSPLTAKRIVGEVRGRPYLFYYWFFTGENSYSEEWQALIRISMQNFLAGRADGGIIEISTALPTGAAREEAIERASQRIDAFLEELRPELNVLIKQG